MLERRRHLRGIVNGIDYDVFNPMKDTYLDKHFSVRELSGKVVNSVSCRRSMVWLWIRMSC